MSANIVAAAPDWLEPEPPPSDVLERCRHCAVEIPPHETFCSDVCRRAFLARPSFSVLTALGGPELIIHA